jgi:hypothetical protein
MKGQRFMKKGEKLKKPRKARATQELVDYWTEGEGLAEIKAWVEAGLYDTQIADNMNVTRKTLYEWKKKYPAVRTLFLNGRKVAVHHVINALYKSAVGFHETEQIIDNMGKKQVINKYHAPNVTAGIFLAKNWSPQEYKDKWDIDVQGKLPIVLSGDDEVAD